MTRPQRNRWIFTAVNIIAIGLLLYLTSQFTNTATKQVSYSEFLDDLRADKLSDVQVTQQELIGVLKADKSHPQSNQERTIHATRLPDVDESQLLKELEAHSVKFGGHFEQASWLWGVLGWIIPLVFIGLIYSVVMRRMAKGAGPLTFGKNRAKIHDESSRIQVSFEDVAGLDEAKVELEEVVDFLRQPAKYQKLGGRIPKGVLQGRAKRYWREPWPERLTSRFSRSQAPSSWRCSSAWARPGYAIYSNRPNRKRPASYLSMSWMP
jgi:cell division protease FtsH